MEDVIEIKTQHTSSITTISIDNSTDYKDFNIKVESKGTKDEKKINIQLSRAFLSLEKQGQICLEIGDISLIGREVELLKEFLNQL